MRGSIGCGRLIRAIKAAVVDEKEISVERVYR